MLTHTPIRGALTYEIFLFAGRILRLLNVRLNLKQLLSLSCWKMLAWGLLRGPPSANVKSSRLLFTQQSYGVSCNAAIFLQFQCRVLPAIYCSLESIVAHLCSRPKYHQEGIQGQYTRLYYQQSIVLWSNNREFYQQCLKHQLSSQCIYFKHSCCIV